MNARVLKHWESFISVVFIALGLGSLKANSHVTSLSYWENACNTMLQHYIDAQYKSADQKEFEVKKDGVLFEILDRINPSSILEVGCGFGYTLKKVALHNKKFECYGCDWSTVLINQAKQYLSGIVPQDKLFVCDAKNMNKELKKYKSSIRVDLIYTSGLCTCLEPSDVDKFFNEVFNFTDKVLLFEPLYTQLSSAEYQTFVKERNYPIHDYEAIVKKKGFIIEEKHEVAVGSLRGIFLFFRPKTKICPF